MEEKTEQPQENALRNKEKGEKIHRRWQALEGELMIWRPQWQEIADHQMTDRAGISQIHETPSTSKDAVLFDTTATDAALTMAGGLMSWTSPPNEQWFNYRPIFQLRKSEAVKQWLAECSERLREMLASSNFYTEMHEDLLNHCVFGTSAMFIGMENGNLHFETLPIGTFAIAENYLKQVDTLFRVLELTAQQAVDMFGEDNLPKDIKDCLKDEKKRDSRHRFIHAVYPRPDNERPDGPGRLAGWGKAFASCYVCEKSKTLVKEGGFDSFPFAVGRYMRWTMLGAKSPYGKGPGFVSLPDTRQVNFLQMILDCAAEKIVRPAMLAPSEMEGDLILSAGGITYVDSSVASERWPKPINQVGDYNVAVDRVKARQEAINMKFHVQLFNMFAGLERQMTAYEVAERAGEKITLISPAFSRIQTEKHNPLLIRIFNLAMENGMLEMPPDEAIIPVSEFMGIVPDPSISYSSRLALALEYLGKSGFTRQLELDMQLAQVRPDIMDAYDFPTIQRDLARTNGVPTNWMLSEERVAEIAAARAQQQQTMMAAAMLEQSSKAVKNVGGVQQAQQALQSLS